MSDELALFSSKHVPSLSHKYLIEFSPQFQYKMVNELCTKNKQFHFQEEVINVRLGGYNIAFIRLWTLSAKQLVSTLSTAFLAFALYGGYALYAVYLYLICRYPRHSAYVLIPYLIWRYYDRRTSCEKGRSSKWVKGWTLWKYHQEYYPVNLIKTADIEPGRNYLFAAYPHNIAPFNAIPNFCTDANEFEKLFAGIEAKVCVASHLVRNPISRELFLALGMRDASENSLRYVLENENSKALVLYPGGAKELQYVETGTDNYVILANCRKGFVRIALSTGTPLVPVFSFGEPYPYDKVHCFKSPRIVDKIPVRVVRSVFSQSFFFWNGRGIFQTSFGLIPRRHPINTIVGKPIPVPKVTNPSDELIAEYHEKFFQELINLFEKYKYDYDFADGKSKLILV